jgi:hypothetical protein
MSKPTPNDYIVRTARQWRESDKAVIAAKDGEKDAAKRAHRVDINNLRTAVDLAIRKDAEQGQGGEP